MKKLVSIAGRGIVNPPFLGYLVTCLSVLITVLPFLRFLHDLGDEGVILNGAVRLLRGQRIYSDFFEFLPPGGFLLVASWFSLAGISFLSERILNLLTIGGIACVAYSCCLRVSRSSAISALIVVNWVIFSQDNIFQLNHHWFATLMMIISMRLSLEAGQQDKQRPLLSGLFAGAAGMIVPTRGAFCVLASACAHIWPKLDIGRLLLLIGGVSAIPVAMVSYLLARGSFGDAFQDVIIWAATQYAPIQYAGFGKGVALSSIPLMFLFQAGALLYVLARVRGVERKDQVGLLCITFAVAGALGCFPRPDIHHLAYGTPLVLPLIALYSARLVQTLRKSHRKWIVAYVVLFGLPSQIQLVTGFRMLSGLPVITTPRGGVVWSGSHGFPRMFEHILASGENDGYIFYPAMAMGEFLSGRKNVASFDYLVPDYTLPSQYKAACFDMVSRANWVVFDRDYGDPATLKKNFPSMKNPRPPETIAFEAAIESNFTAVSSDGIWTLFRHNPGVDQKFCSGIPDRPAEGPDAR